VTPQSPSRRVRLGSHAAALFLISLVLILAVVTVPLAGLAHQGLNADNGTVWVAAAGAAVGFVLAWRRPGNPLGWIMLGGAAFLALSEDGGFYAVADYRLHHGGLSLGWVALLAQPGWAPWLVLLGLALLLFPDGRPPSRRWRWVLWVYAGIGLVWIVWTAAITVSAIIGHHTQVDSSGQLLLLSGNDPAAGWWNAMQVVFIVGGAPPAAEVAAGRVVLADECCHTDRDEDSGQFDAELGDVAGRRLGREPPCIFLIQSGEVGRMGEQYAHLDDITQTAASRLEDGLAVRQRLSCLVLDRVSGQAAGARIDTGHT
jgi:hypothetical protein